MTTPASQNRKLWLVLGFALVLVVLIPAWLLVISPVRSDAETLRLDTDAVEAQNAQLEAKTNDLKAKAEHRPALVAKLGYKLAELPWETKLPEFSNQLTTHAKTNHVKLTSVAVGSPTAPGQPPSTSVDNATALAIPITVVSRGSAVNQLLFLRDVQEIGPRRALVQSSSIVPTKQGSIEGNSTMTVQIMVFTSPVAPDLRAQLKQILSQTTSEDTTD